ncbi:MAG: potassium channel family protein [Crocinitomicaceae bacterium]|nr:potassium channel family protein [Crocinitomicaceae bacterium]
MSFENAVFRNGDISFLNAFFNDGLINFKSVDFGDGDVSFHYSEFGDGDVIFHRSKFNAGLVDFSKVNFGEGKVDFRHCDFKNSEVSFEEIDHKNNRLLFKRARFGNRKISFNKAEFGDGSLTFNGAKCSRISLKNYILSNYLDLRVHTCRIIDLSDSIVQNLVDLERGNNPVYLDRLYIYGVRILGKIFISWEDNNIKQIIGEQYETSYVQKMDQYRILKEVFHSTGQYEDEDRAYVEFKRNELLAKLKERKENGCLQSFIDFVGYGLKKSIFDWVGLYATSPARVLFSIFLIYGAYSVLYVLFELSGHGEISCITPDLSIFEKVIDSFYFSAVTFLTIGYGDCTPTGIFKVIAPFEGLMGVFMMSYFTVAFARKILR